MSNTKKRLIWNKRERARAKNEQVDVAREYQSLLTQIAEIESHDVQFLDVAHAASQYVIEIAQTILSLDFTVKNTRGCFPSVRQFIDLINQFKAGLYVWNLTMQSDQAQASMKLASFRKQHKEQQRLKQHEQSLSNNTPNQSHVA